MPVMNIVSTISQPNATLLTADQLVEGKLYVVARSNFDNLVGRPAIVTQVSGTKTLHYFQADSVRSRTMPTKAVKLRFREATPGESVSLVASNTGMSAPRAPQATPNSLTGALETQGRALAAASVSWAETGSHVEKIGDNYVAMIVPAMLARTILRLFMRTDAETLTTLGVNAQVQPRVLEAARTLNRKLDAVSWPARMTEMLAPLAKFAGLRRPSR